MSFWESSCLKFEYIDGHSFVLSQGVEVTLKSVKKYNELMQSFLDDDQISII